MKRARSLKSNKIPPYRIKAGISQRCGLPDQHDLFTHVIINISLQKINKSHFNTYVFTRVKASPLIMNWVTRLMFNQWMESHPPRLSFSTFWGCRDTLWPQCSCNFFFCLVTAFDFEFGSTSCKWGSTMVQCVALLSYSKGSNPPSVWFLHIQPVSVWFLSRRSSFLPQSQRHAVSG